MIFNATTKMIIVLLSVTVLMACDKHYRAGNKELPLNKEAYYPSKQHPHRAKTKEETPRPTLEKIDARP